ncbi:membrane-flanked domain protein [Halalkaliarchaeum desulfuricum]|uniref:Membrane-flanked domain protein n=1 Tax=Halalkaliarchaeum desulfuricum TaxID=2055893 RepID=A0A343TL38_9EURY|nr:membrane-flanked domain protein [Halalkaliarchaeum desulfuricum]
MAADDWRRFDEEAVLWEATPRTTRALPGMGLSVALLVGVFWLAVTVSGWALVLVPAAAAPGLFHYLRVVTTAFVLTDREITVKTGILGRSVRSVEYSRVQNVGYSQGVTGSVFGYGTVEIEIAGGRDLQLYDVYDPTEPYEIVRECATGTATEIPGSLETWEAIREEVTALRERIESQ